MSKMQNVPRPWPAVYIKLYFTSPDAISLTIWHYIIMIEYRFKFQKQWT